MSRTRSASAGAIQSRRMKSQVDTRSPLTGDLRSHEA
jgi:hypothetical protein